MHPVFLRIPSREASFVAAMPIAIVEDSWWTRILDENELASAG